MSDCIAVFNTTYETLRAEDFFRAEKIKFKPILKPRKIGSACRMALKFSEKDIESAKRAVTAGNLELLSFYRHVNDTWVKF
ncbi:MAG: DUF3343 domain-containing protein [Nitrospinota bacterium]|nr:DUF3343 domain-containing protein [Nitrospinota bacterium]